MWARFLNTAIGLWLMAAPAVLGYLETGAATNDHTIGPLAATMAIIAMWDVTRPLRRLNLVFGLWLMAAPWLLGYEQSAAVLNDSAAGLLLALFSLHSGPPPQPMGGGWRMLFIRNRS